MSVVHAPRGTPAEEIRAQQLRELACVDAVTLTAFFQKSIPTGIAYHQMGRPFILRRVTGQVPKNSSSFWASRLLDCEA
jgi:hypothetical protein